MAKFVINKRRLASTFPFNDQYIVTDELEKIPSFSIRHIKRPAPTEIPSHLAKPTFRRKRSMRLELPFTRNFHPPPHQHREKDVVRMLRTSLVKSIIIFSAASGSRRYCRGKSYIAEISDFGGIFSNSTSNFSSFWDSECKFLANFCDGKSVLFANSSTVV